MALSDAVEIKGISELADEKKRAENAKIEAEQKEAQEKKAQAALKYSSLSAHIKEVFRINKDARRNSGVETEMVDSMLDINGIYSADDQARIKEIEMGSDIFMNIPSTKCATLAAWIKDVYLNSIEKPWGLKPSKIKELPQPVLQQIEEQVAMEFMAYTEMQAQKKAMAHAQSAEEAQKQGKPAPSSVEASHTLREVNQIRRDLIVAIMDEIDKEATFQAQKLEGHVEDQLTAGGWEKALSEFIDYFSVYPTAFMKGPILTKKQRVKWVHGKPVAVTDYYFNNKCPNPLDMYPAPGAIDIDDGDLVEHIRWTRSETSALKQMPEEAGYKKENVDLVLEDRAINVNGHPTWLNDYIESDKALVERRGNVFEANQNIIHGFHAFVSVPARILREWGFEDDKELAGAHDNDEFEVEAILLEEEVVKCRILKDPFFRRPYYKASFRNVPGSFWGKSLPALIRDNTRMCNATARALANNMGISSGPQVVVNVERLADDGAIEAMKPWKMWQTKNDIVGGSNMPVVDFFQPNSNASELLGVYRDYEQRADTVLGIPDISLSAGGGGSSPAMSLSMILDNMSKGIKAAIRNIDIGVIKPRIDYQFHWNLLKNPDLKFTGDIEVVPKASQILIAKASEQLRRNEFLQITSNPNDQGIMGAEGRGALLREMSKDLGMTETIVPTRLEIMMGQEKQQASQAKQAEAERNVKLQQKQLGLQATKEQIGGQERMHDKGLQFDMKVHQDDMQLEIARLQQNAYSTDKGQRTLLEKQKLSDATKTDLVNKELAFKWETGRDGI